MTEPKRWREHQDRWEADRLEPTLERAPERRDQFVAAVARRMARL